MDDLTKLDSFSADCFMLIDIEIDKIHAEEAKKAQRKRK